jgi:hypothetical protein
MTNETDQNEPSVEIPGTGSIADRIAYCEGLENSLLAKLYQAETVEEQTPIMEKMDFIATVLDRLSESQQAVQAAGKAVTSHQDGGFTPHDRVRALDVLMEEAAGSGDINTYKMYRTQRHELIRKYGAPGHTTSTTMRNPRIENLKKIANTYQSEHCGADIETRMDAAAAAGDMATYKELRTQRRQQQA